MMLDCNWGDSLVTILDPFSNNKRECDPLRKR